MKKKIIFSNYDDIRNPYYGGGGAIAIHEVAKRLVTDFYVTVITGNYPKAKADQIDGVNYKRIGFSFAGPKIGQLLFQFLLPFSVMRESYDCWIESFTPPFSTGFLQLFTKKPVIGLTHMLAGEDMLRKYKLPFFLIENMGLKTYRKIITTTEFMKEKIQNISPKTRIAVIPNGITLPAVSSEKHAKQHILFIGRLEMNQKGLDLLLHAYAKVKDRISYPLVIAGAGIEQDEMALRQMILDLQLEKQVTLLGRVTGEEKARAFQEAIFAVTPSRFDSFSMTSLEAFSYHLPIVMFAIKELSWIPDELALKVRPFDTSAFAEAMLRMCEDTRLRTSIAKEAGLFSEHFTWDKIAQAYKVLVEKSV